MFFFVDGNQWNELVRLLVREGCKPMPALHTGETSACEVMCFMHLNILRHVYSILLYLVLTRSAGSRGNGM